jgi:hypothetical protein
MAAFIARLKPMPRAKASDKPSRLAAFWQAAAPSLLNAVLVLLVGYLLTGKVEQALKDRQATVTSVNAMNDLLVAIAGEKAEVKRQGLVRRLSMYGVDAIGPLVTLGLTTDLPIQLPAEGLTLIAIRHPEAVCAALDRAGEVGDQFPDASNQVGYLKKLSTRLQCQHRRTPWWKL